MSKASQGQLDALHGLVAGALADELRRAAAAAAEPKTVRELVEGSWVEKPNPTYQALNPQLIDNVLKFLKDNGIDSPAKGQAVSNLAEALKDLDASDFGPSS